MIENEKIYTLQELADYLGITRQCLYNNIRKGKLQLPKVGKSYIVTESKLQDILKYGYSGNPNK